MKWKLPHRVKLKHQNTSIVLDLGCILNAAQLSTPSCNHITQNSHHLCSHQHRYLQQEYHVVIIMGKMAIMHTKLILDHLTKVLVVPLSAATQLTPSTIASATSHTLLQHHDRKDAQNPKYLTLRKIDRIDGSGWIVVFPKTMKTRFLRRFANCCSHCWLKRLHVGIEHSGEMNMKRCAPSMVKAFNGSMKWWKAVACICPGPAGSLAEGCLWERLPATCRSSK